MADGNDSNPLVQRVDALMRRRSEPARSETDVPVLTEIVADDRPARPAVDRGALEALARELERAVLERLGAEIDRVIDEKLGRSLSQALEGMRSELTASVTQTVREAVAASVAHALGFPKRD